MRQLPRDTLHGEHGQKACRDQRLSQPRRGAQRKQIFQVRRRIDALQLEPDGAGDARSLRRSARCPRPALPRPPAPSPLPAAASTASISRRMATSVGSIVAGSQCDRRTQRKKTARTLRATPPSIAAAEQRPAPSRRPVFPPRPPIRGCAGCRLPCAPSRAGAAWPVRCALRPSLSPRPVCRARRRDQPLGHVEQSGKARLDKARPQRQRANQDHESGQRLQRHGQRHHRQLRAQLAQKRHRNLHQQGCRQHRRGQFQRRQKQSSRRAHNRQRRRRRQA